MDQRSNSGSSTELVFMCEQLQYNHKILTIPTPGLHSLTLLWELPGEGGGGGGWLQWDTTHALQGVWSI